MGGGLGTSSSTQNTQQQSQTNPWAPAIPVLQGFLGNIGNLAGNITPTGATANAFSSIAQNAGNVPDYTNQALNFASNLIGGGNNYAPMVQDAYGKQSAALSPIMSASLDPTQTPGIGDQLDALQRNISGSINSQFAGAGRDLSGANAMALGKGLTQGMAPVLTAQYNANVNNALNASSQLGQAANQGAGSLSALQQTGFGNTGQGFDWLTSGLPNATNAGALNTIAANQMPFQYSTGNLGQLLGLTAPIAGLGGQSSGTSNTQGTQTQSPWSMMMQGANALSNFGFKFSDRRLKKDIEQIGTLFDGTPVYRFKYLTSDMTHVGLMAQDVEKFAPDAVTRTDAGYMMLDYGVATERAAKQRTR